MTRKSYLYLAGPLFNQHERDYLDKLAAKVEALGYDTFLPHRDAGVIREWNYATRKRVFDTDVAALDRCDACIALLTGADHDAGTAMEIGYLYAKGKPVFGLTDDVRSIDLNNMCWGGCGEGQRVARTIDEVVAMVEAWRAS
jgi:nucleoside 2-deoxyribosyltransferase